MGRGAVGLEDCDRREVPGRTFPLRSDGGSVGDGVHCLSVSSPGEPCGWIYEALMEDGASLVVDAGGEALDRAARRPFRGVAIGGPSQGSKRSG